MSNSRGIDYGMGTTNIDKNNIRYGVIPAHAVDYWYDESEPYYPCEECEHNVEEDCYEMCDPSSWYVNNEEISAEQTQDDCDIVVMKSKYYTYAQFGINAILLIQMVNLRY